MNAITESPNLGDLIKFEEGSLNYSREVVTVAIGQILELGSVVSRITDTENIKRLDPAATDGSQTPVGILLGDVNAAWAQREGALLLARHAVVASSAVVWPSDITDLQKEVAIARLASIGILVRVSV